ncbi:MAG: sulfurtransferase TusA family protein [Cellulomonas iranensis]|nr:sulfurtransferase TusA family protein [Cellulomonas iranensis]
MPAHDYRRPVAEHAGVVTIDGGDLGCARLLLLLRDRVTTLAPGTVVHLVTTDPVAPVDLPVWCHMTGHVYRGVVAGPDDRPTYAVEVAERPAATDARHPWRLGQG